MVKTVKTKKLGEYIDKLRAAGLLVSESSEEFAEIKIGDISDDSRAVAANALFVCKGRGFKKKYAEEAARNGAVCFISENDIGQTPLIKVKDIRASLPVIADVFTDCVQEKLRIIGITGTKGKTTVAYFLRAILDAAAGKTALLSSADAFDGKRREEANLTTPEVFDLRKFMQRAHGNGCEFLVMEVSSQALKYGRTAGLEFEVGILLNIGSDHISEIEHPDEEDYVASKLLIAKQSKTLLFNEDMDEAKRFLQRLKGEERNIKLFGNGDHEIDIALSGDFNRANAEAAIAAAGLLGIPGPVSEAAIKDVKVPGRMEVFPLGDGKVAIVDYAHNKMSFDALFAAVRKDYPDAQKTIIFGAPGGKALNRRVELAESSAENADRVYLVEEDANYEPPEKIAREIEANVRRFAGERPVETKVIVDRKAAILDAIKTSAPGGVIIIAAKGRETTLKREGKFVPYPTDVEIVEGCM